VREPKDYYFLRQAQLAATQGTCLRRHVGAVAVNARGHLIATGVNGVPSKLPHCNEGHACPGAGAAPGTDLDRCLAVHAEVNLLAQCRDVWEIDTVYLTASPCFNCTKALLTSGTRRLVFLELYPHPAALALWTGAGRRWEQMALPVLSVAGVGSSREPNRSDFDRGAYALQAEILGYINTLSEQRPDKGVIYKAVSMMTPDTISPAFPLGDCNHG